MSGMISQTLVALRKLDIYNVCVGQNRAWTRTENVGLSSQICKHSLLDVTHVARTSSKPQCDDGGKGNRSARLVQVVILYM